MYSKRLSLGVTVCVGKKNIENVKYRFLLRFDTRAYSARNILRFVPLHTANQTSQRIHQIHIHLFMQI